MERPFRVWACPVMPRAFLGLMGWVFACFLLVKSVESLCWVAIVVLGIILCYSDNLMKKIQYVMLLVCVLLGVSTLEARADIRLSLHENIRKNALNQTARIIAGIYDKTDTLFETTRRTGAWKTYCNESDTMWTTYSTKNKALFEWATHEAHPATRGVTSLFYPFSGPDFMYANLFFPDARVTYAIGLEPLGTVPQFGSNIPVEDATGRYKASISEVLTDSYYRTKNMMRDLNNKSVDGIVPVVMLFMARSQMSIAQINFVVLDEDGSIVPFDAEKMSGNKHRGVEFVYYSESNDAERKFYYFKIDLQNASIDKNLPVKNFLNRMSHEASFSKSASYLMHNSSFSIVRDAVLKSSKVVISDDSAVPFRYYDKNIWNIKLYGKYTSPIKEFEYIFENDLADAYKSPDTTVKPLVFRIGYRGRSNMRIAIRHSNVI